MSRPLDLLGERRIPRPQVDLLADLPEVHGQRGAPASCAENGESAAHARTPIRRSVPARRRRILPRWRNRISAPEPAAAKTTAIGSPLIHAAGGSATVAAIEPSETYLVTAHDDEKEPGGHGRRDRGQNRENAGSNGHALTAVEPQPDGIDVSDDRRGRGQRGQRDAGVHHRRQRDRQRSLGDVERHDQDRAPRAGGPHHVRRAHIAAAGKPHVDPGAPRQQERERHRSREVSEQDGPHQANGTRSSGS